MKHNITNLSKKELDHINGGIDIFGTIGALAGIAGAMEIAHRNILPGNDNWHYRVPLTVVIGVGAQYAGSFVANFVKALIFKNENE